jgi:hypothetical protein
MAFGVRALGARSCRRSRRTGKPSPGENTPVARAACCPGNWGDGYARGREPEPIAPRDLESRMRRKYPVRFGGGLGEKAARTSLAVYPTFAAASGSG